MNRNLLWIQAQTRKWHAWPVGAQRTVCTQISASDLAVRPALAIHQDSVLDASHVRCGTCLSWIRRHDPILAVQLEAIPTSEDPSTKRWLGLIRRHVTKVRGRLSARNEIAVAERLASIGSPDDAEAMEAFERICLLLLTPQTKSDKRGRTYHTFTWVSEALALLPLEDPTRLQHVLSAMQMWQRITGRSLALGKFQRPCTIATILDIPATDLEAYIEHCATAGVVQFNMMFHPNTLEYRKKHPSLRGAFDKDNEEYWDSAKPQLNIVSDDDEDDSNA